MTRRILRAAAALAAVAILAAVYSAGRANGIRHAIYDAELYIADRLEPDQTDVPVCIHLDGQIDVSIASIG